MMLEASVPEAFVGEAVMPKVFMTQVLVSGVHDTSPAPDPGAETRRTDEVIERSLLYPGGRCRMPQVVVGCRLEQ
jgi:hypothetical protein